MERTAAAAQPAFIVNTGDNFYWCGIQNATDPQIHVDFELPYSAPSLSELDWFSILGNHEYGYNSQAELDYSMLNAHWVMPARYYTKRVTVDEASGVYLSFIFLDTTPCIAGYRQNNPANWDPCSTSFPTCSPGATDDDFEGPCNFHANVLEQSCDSQYAWFVNQLQAVPAGDWLVIVGHHPADEINVFDFTSAMQKRTGGFSLYLNGHAHTLTQYTIDGYGSYVTSGAGSLVNTPDQSSTAVTFKLNGESQHIEDPTDNAHNSHTYQTIFNQKVAGFTTHTFNSDFTILTTAFVSYTGEVVHSFSSSKDGTIQA
jgi:tartrate-resistant acid phosphatase type 5